MNLNSSLRAMMSTVGHYLQASFVTGIISLHHLTSIYRCSLK